MERRKDSAREEIADIALELFTRDGFDNTPVESIAAAAGCSPRTVYRYFGSKEDLMFYDLPAVIDELTKVLTLRLTNGLDEWTALTESLVDFIRRFDAGDQDTAIQRMELWSHEPALRARYLQYVAETERKVLDCLCRARGTSAESDNLAQLMALAAVGAYRATVTTHRASHGGLAEHLRASLATLGAGLAR